MEELKHTKEPWHWHNEKTYNLAGKGSYQDGNILQCKGKPSNGDADLIALAPAAPHDCDDPSCPGDMNRRKLEAAEGMARALTTISGWSKCQCREKHGDNDNCCVLIAEAALSAWKQAGKGEGCTE